MYYLLWWQIEFIILPLQLLPASRELVGETTAVEGNAAASDVGIAAVLSSAAAAAVAECVQGHPTINKIK